MATEASPLQLIDPYIERTTNQRTVQSLSSLLCFLVPSAEFLTFTLVGCLFYWVVSSLLGRFRKSSRSPKRNVQNIVAFFFVWFLFFTSQLFSGSLNTSNMQVRTDNLLYSTEQILTTKKEFCSWEKSTEEDLFRKVSCPMLSITCKRWSFSIVNLFAEHHC